MSLQYDREELYQKVWERPLVKIAPEYGVSAVALAKACRRLFVPVPGRGHWAKLACGHPGTPKQSLRKLDKVPVVFRSAQSDQKKEAMRENEIDPEFAAIEQLLSSGALNPPAMDPSAKPHVLIRRTSTRLRSRKRKDERGVLLPKEPGGLDVAVTAETIDRALQVMSQVLGVLESRGFTIEVTGTNRTAACINGQRVHFGIEETIRRDVTQKPRVPQPKESWDYDRIVTYQATGKLQLIIYSGTWRSNAVRKRWTDAKIQRVENLIADFVVALMRTAVVLRREEEENKQRELERQRRAQEMIKLREQIEAEEKRVKQFDQWVESWERAERLRRFIAFYAETTSKWSADRQLHYKEWIEWANRQADRVDPFISEKPASVLDRKHELSW